MRVVDSSQMRELERRTIEQRGIPAIDLMESAAQRIVQAAIELVDGSHMLILCGKGNNGGDGFCAARQLSEMGYSVTVVPVFGTEGLPKTAHMAWDRLQGSRARIVPLFEISTLDQLLDEADGVIDAVLGIGIKLPVREPLPEIIAKVRASGLPVIAADIPSGLDAETGGDGPAMTAHCTVTFGLPKKGMLTAAGVRHCGHVRVEHLQFPTDLLADPALRHSTLTLSDTAELLPPRPINGHKGTFGAVAVVAGSATMPGAAVLCGTGALRGGAGLVRMAVPAAIRQTIQLALPECLHPISITAGESELQRIEDQAALSSSQAVVFGPGVGTHAEAADVLETLLREYTGHLVLDADALNILAAKPELLGFVGSRVVLTPHPGELARLLQCTTRDIESDRWGSAERAARKFGCVVLLKGFGSLVATPEGEILHIPSGNTALSRGGSGDLLAGVIAAQLAQGAQPRAAAAVGSFVCGLAADILVRENSPRGLTVGDIAGALGAAFREIEQASRP